MSANMLILVRSIVARRVVEPLRRAIETDRDRIMKIVGETAVDQIQRNTRSGSGVSDGKKIRLERLSKSYIALRKRHPPTGREGKVSKSNLTYTGQMIEAIRYVKRAGKHIIEVADTARTGSAIKRRDKMTNKGVARAVSNPNTRTGAPARPFLDLDAARRKVVLREARKQVSILIKRLKQRR